MKHLTKEILDEDEKNTKRDLEHLNQICGHLDGILQNFQSGQLNWCVSSHELREELRRFDAYRLQTQECLFKIAEARKRLEL